MNTTSLFGTTAGIMTTLFAGGLMAADAPPDTLNRFSFGSTFGFDARASFSDGLPRGTPVPLAGAASGGGIGTKFNYSDGFVGVDSSANAGGLTWFWGYQNARQVDAVNDRILYNTAAPGADGQQSSRTGDPQLGFDLLYERQLLKRESFTLGLQLGFAWTDLKIRGQTAHLTDAFGLGGATPPTAPFLDATVGGPNPLISDTPTRGQTLTQHDLAGNLYSWRFGPVIDFAAASKISITLSGGIALGLIDSEYGFAESGTIGGLAIPNRSLQNRHNDYLVGAYAEARAIYHVNRNWGVYTGLQYQYLGKFQRGLAEKQMSLNLDAPIMWSLGVTRSF